MSNAFLVADASFPVPIKQKITSQNFHGTFSCLKNNVFSFTSLPAVKCSKLTIKTLEQGVTTSLVSF